METLGALGGIGVLIFLFILFVLGVILPISVYSAQKWAHRCFLELEKLNRKFDQHFSGQSSAPRGPPTS